MNRQDDHQEGFGPSSNKARSLRLVAQPGQYSPTPEDRALEARIEEACEAFNRADCRRTKRAMYEQIRNLHRQRSPEYVEYMEWQKGLAR